MMIEIYAAVVTSGLGQGRLALPQIGRGAFVRFVVGLGMIGVILGALSGAPASPDLTGGTPDVAGSGGAEDRDDLVEVGHG